MTEWYNQGSSVSSTAAAPRTCYKATLERGGERESQSSGPRCWCCTFDNLHMTSSATCSDILDVRRCGGGQSPSRALFESNTVVRVNIRLFMSKEEMLWWISPVEISCKSLPQSSNQPCWYWKNKHRVRFVLSFMLFSFFKGVFLWSLFRALLSSLKTFPLVNGGKWAASLISAHEMVQLARCSAGY